MSENKEVTVILTSCGRFDLLIKTIDSFLIHNTYPIKEFIIHEDSGYKMVGRDDYPFIRWIYKIEGQPNQIEALDTLWSMVDTPYAFHCEDDWEFLRPGFIEASMEVLEADPNILMCWLQPLEENNTHPIEWNDKYGVLKTAGGLWSGTRFNPALRRKVDYDYLGSYGAHTTFDRSKPWKAEADIAKVYHAAGFKGAMLKEQYIKHIGVNRHVGA